MIIRPLKAIASGKNLVLIEIEEKEKQHPHEIVNFYAEKKIIFLPKNCIGNPGNYAFSRKKSRIYQPVMLDNKVMEVLSLRKDQGEWIWKEITIREDVPFSNCCLLGLKP